MIWDFIRDFLVQYIFGGTTSKLEMYQCYIGSLFNSENAYALEDNYTYNTYLKLDGYNNVEGISFDYISIGDWLSTTATIIIMALAVVLACLLVRWVWRAVSSAMLLR